MADIAFSIQRANTSTGEYDVKLPKPHPFFTDESGLIIEHVSLTGGRIIGFNTTPETGILDKTWNEFTSDPEEAVTMHVVMVEPDGTLSTWGHPVSRIADLRGMS